MNDYCVRVKTTKITTNVSTSVESSVIYEIGVFVFELLYVRIYVAMFRSFQVSYFFVSDEKKYVPFKDI